MSIRYHETIELLGDVLEENAVPLDAATVIVRDGSGRLAVARAEVQNEAKLAADLKAKLEGYAANIPVVTGSAANRLLGDPTLRTLAINRSGTLLNVKYADRRLVGQDWLQKPQAMVATPPRLVFGSLKGGVGRSTALAVLAAELARLGKKVLAIDLDLEAPGIGFMLLPGSDDLAKDRRPRFGVIDYLVENNLGGVKDEELYDFVGVSTFADGAINVIPAVGRETDNHPATMISKLSRALVEDVVGGKVVTVADQVRQMVDRFAAREKYDAILVDARAGLSEITAAPLLGLGAEIFLFGVDQPQTFHGYTYMFAHLNAVAASEAVKEVDWRQHLTFVQAKAPSSASKRLHFREKLYELCADYIYDEETVDSDGDVKLADFNPGPNEVGPGVPHDALFISYHPEYDAFDPLTDKTQLDPDVYSGPFGQFISRMKQLLKIDVDA